MVLKKQEILVLFLKLVIITGPITSWFALSTTLRLPIIFLSALFLIYFIFLLKNSFRFHFKSYTEDFFLVLWALSFLFSVLYNATWFHSRLITNTIAAFLLVFGFYFFPRLVIKDSRIKLDELMSAFYYAICILYCIIILDFILNNFFAISLMDYFTIAEVYNSKGFSRAIWHSSSSPSEEPATVAYFINTYWSFASIYLFKKKRKKAILMLSLVHVLCMILLVSTSGFVFFFLALLAGYVFSGKWNKIFKSLTLLTVLFSILLISNPYNFRKKMEKLSISSEFLLKISLNTKNQSAGDRVRNWTRSFNDWIESPVFGLGPGISKVRYNGDNYYGLITYSAASLGSIGGLSIILFLGFLSFRVFKANFDSNAKFFIITALFLSISKNFISDEFLNIPFWISLVVLNQYAILEKEKIETDATQ